MMRSMFLKALGLLLGGCVGITVMAAEPDIAKVSAAITARLSQARPDLEFAEVAKSPVEGIYEVQVVGGPLLYTTENGDFFFVGDLYEVRPGQFVNLREVAFAKTRRELLASVPLDKMIVFAPEGKSKAIVNVFTDVDCGFCRKLHQEVPELNRMGIEVRYLAYPRAGINSPSYRKIASAWCAEDQQTALTALKNGQSIAENVCPDNPVADQYRLGQQAGVTGTPALVLMDGTMVPGYRSADELAKILSVDVP